MGDMRAEDAPEHVQLVDDDIAEPPEERGPPRVERKHPDVEHLRIGQHDVRVPAHPRPRRRLGVTVIGRRDESGKRGCRDPPQLVLRECLGGEDQQRRRRVDAADGLCDRGLVHERLARRGPGRDHHRVAVPYEVQRLGLMTPEEVDAQSLQHLVGQRLGEQGGATRARGLLFDVHELALGRQRLEQVLEHLPILPVREAVTLGSMDLALQIFEQRGWQVVLVSGELDVATAPRLHEQLVTLASQGHRRIAIDLNGVTMFDWMGLGAVLGVLARVRALGGELVLVSPTAVVRELLELTEIDGVLPIHASLDTVPA